jgi:hypothetical protein
MVVRGCLRVLLCVAVAFIGTASADTAELRVALVVGNSAYAAAPLPNAANDARDVTTVLKGMGFEVVEVRNGTQADIRRGVAEARGLLQGRKGVGLFYYAGHGMQLDWRNYMLPVDAAPRVATDIAAMGVDTQAVIDAFKAAGTRINILVLDACRDNPFGQVASSKGLAPMDAPPGTYMAYATAPGNVAEDGSERDGNGLFARFLVKELQRPDARIEEVFKRVRLQVRQVSQGRQVPWDSSSLEEDFVFATGKKVAEPNREERESAFLVEKAAWDRIKASAVPDDLYTFLQAYPNGAFSEPAQFRLERLSAAKVEAAAPQSGVRVLPAGQDRYRVGDRFEYDAFDYYGRPQPARTLRVTAIKDGRIEFNGGNVVWDAMGNLIKDGGGTREPAKVVLPAELAIGKTWQTSFVADTPRGIEKNHLSYRVVALEAVDVPAGRFMAYKIEGSGWAGYAHLTETHWIDPATFARVKLEWVSRWNSRVEGSARVELRRMELVPRVAPAAQPKPG